MAKPPSIHRAQIEHVATLASLSLNDAEKTAMATELAAIVKYVDELNEVDTTGVPATLNVQLEHAAWRADVIEPSLTHEEALAEAPQEAHGGFAVPVFVEG
ncbi:MAG: Asp-tRNA(Asn)/Glu-tRNA(Gln) amidotransferase subunit GatC [Polyangiaceae bacterium]